MNLVVLSHLQPILCGKWCYLFNCRLQFFWKHTIVFRNLSNNCNEQHMWFHEYLAHNVGAQIVWGYCAQSYMHYFVRLQTTLAHTESNMCTAFSLFYLFLAEYACGTYWTPFYVSRHFASYVWKKEQLALKNRKCALACKDGIILLLSSFSRYISWLTQSSKKHYLNNFPAIYTSPSITKWSRKFKWKNIICCFNVISTALHNTHHQGCSGVGTAFPHLFALETLLEDLDFSYQFLQVEPGAA